MTEKATTLPTQVAAHFFFGTDITHASQPATGADFGGLGYALNAARHPTGTPREPKGGDIADRRRRRLSEWRVATNGRTGVAPHQAPSAARRRGQGGFHFCQSFFVMPAKRVSTCFYFYEQKNVDARHKAGHDELRR